VIVGRSPSIIRAKALVDRYARTRLPFLLVGATGTGKELFAQYIHHCSGRSGPFLDVNCGAVPREMAESLLFGHRRGSFTGAIETVRGYVEGSSGGTLFLDELTALHLEGQAKLLRVLETGAVPVLGGLTKVEVDLRVVAAVPAGILRELDGGRFRRDLYQRVAGVVVELLPLSARMEDVIPTADHFASLQGRRLEPAVAPILLNYSWPGNVRELRQVIERAGQLVDDGVLSAAAVAEGIALGLPSSEVARGDGGNDRRVEYDPALLLSAMSREELLSKLEANGWHAGRTAQSLRVGRTIFFAALRGKGIRLRERKLLARDASSRE